jgi:hypothetical protein
MSSPLYPALGAHMIPPKTVYIFCFLKKEIFKKISRRLISHTGTEKI